MYFTHSFAFAPLAYLQLAHSAAAYAQHFVAATFLHVPLSVDLPSANHAAFLGLSERLLRGHPQRLAFRPRFGCTELQSSRCLTGSQHGRCIARCRNKPWRQSCGRQCSRHLVCSGRHGHKHCDVSGRRSRYRRKVARHCPWESMKPGPPGRCGPRDRTHAMQRAKR